MDQSSTIFLEFDFDRLFFSQDLETFGELHSSSSEAGFPFPIIDDSDRNLAKQLGMIDPDEFDNRGLPLTARAVRFFVDASRLIDEFIFCIEGFLHRSRQEGQSKSSLPGDQRKKLRVRFLLFDRN